VKLGVVALATPLIPLVAAGHAYADYAPNAGDVVGFGGDTPQYAIDFGLNGDTHADAGFDSAGAFNRVVYFDAVADANGRAAYAQGSTSSKAIALNPTDVLREGTNPVQRNSSSGNAISSLLLDTGPTETVNFIASSTLPTAAQQTTAGNNGWGFLHVVEIGTDSIQIAADATTNAPPLSTQDLLNIYTGTYTTWGNIPGYSTTHTSAQDAATINLVLPPSSSTVTKTFLADLKTANGGTAPTAKTGGFTAVEQNDPTAITGASDTADTIVPFSTARFNLWSGISGSTGTAYGTGGYFNDPTVTFGNTPTQLSPGIQLLSGTSPSGGSSYNSGIKDYVIFRQSDAGSTTPLEPGGTRNWVQTLFSNPGGSTPYFDRATGQNEIAAAGIDPVYLDLGDVSNG
jgi:hypothetical protein